MSSKKKCSINTAVTLVAVAKDILELPVDRESFAGRDMSYFQTGLTFRIYLVRAKCCVWAPDKAEQNESTEGERRISANFEVRIALSWRLSANVTTGHSSITSVARPDTTSTLYTLKNEKSIQS